MCLKLSGPLKWDGFLQVKTPVISRRITSAAAASHQPYVAGKNAGTVNYRRGSFAGHAMEKYA
jgi:hypothetical protein